MIYGFRGAVPHELLSKVQEMNFTNYFLERNYRSTQNIVDAANSLIQVNPQANDFSAFSRNEVGSKILHITCKDPAQQAVKIAAMIGSIVKTSAERSDPILYKDIAILYRTSFLSRQIEEIMLQYHIPYVIVNGLSFYDRMEVKDLMSYIRFIINPQDDIALRRILNVPKRKLGDVAVKNISEYLVQCFKNYGIMEVTQVIERLREYGEGDGKKFKLGINSFCNAIDDILLYMKVCNEPGEILEKIISTINYKNYLEAYDKDTWHERYGNVCELLTIAHGNIDLLDFMESMTMDRTKDPCDKDVVKLMTVHGSKGLEFKVVFVVACNESLFPHFRCSDTVEGVREERRLMYVAMTRAKKHLILSDMKEIKAYGQRRQLSPSRFLNQINKQYLIEKTFC